MVAELLSFAGRIARAGGKTRPIALGDPPNDALTQRFHRCCPEQVPSGFKINQLASEISSWVSSVLRIAASSLTAQLKTAMSPATGAGGAGSASAPKLAEAL